jgi:hypothetical protein
MAACLPVNPIAMRAVNDVANHRDNDKEGHRKRSIPVRSRSREHCALRLRHYVMERGRIVDMIARADVASQAARIQAYLGI